MYIYIYTRTLHFSEVITKKNLLTHNNNKILVNKKQREKKINNNNNKYWKYNNQKLQQQWFLTGALLHRTKYCVAIARLSKSPALQCKTCRISYHPTCAKMPLYYMVRYASSSVSFECK